MKKIRLSNCVFIVVVMLISFSVVSAQTRISVLVNGMPVTNDLAPVQWIKQNNTSAKYPKEVLIKFKTIPAGNIRELLKASGVVLYSYLGQGVYLTKIKSLQDLSILNELGVVRIADVIPAWKVSRDLLSSRENANDRVDVNVLLHVDVAHQELISLIEKLGGDITHDRSKSMNYYTVNIHKAKLLQLAGSHYVSYISEHFEDVALNSDAKAITRGRVAANPVNLGGYALDGKGVTVGVGDNTSGIFHVDMSDRIINYNPYGYTNHGVHINGIVGGAGIVDPKGEGMAPASLLCDLFFSDVLDRTPEIFQQHNVTVTNNSYTGSRGSCEYSGRYDVLSAGLDKLCLDYPKVFQVFAAANDGLFDCSPYPAGFATIAGGYQPAKNILVVASTDKEYVNADNSSRGPVRDGRLKPEISAVGVDVNSATKNDEYLVASGTSMACPQVAGAAALLTQRMTQINGITQPRSDVLKTLLINGATDIGTKGPDYRFGFGFLDVERSLIMLDSNRYLTGVITNGGEATNNIIVPQGMSKLKIALYWHDAPASVLAEKQLVDDLDLTVAEPGGNIHNPLILDQAPANILKPAVEGVDRLNNIEQVVIDNPIAGNYTIVVKGYEVSSGNRDFVIAYDYLPAGVSIKYPLADAQVKAGDSLYTYWNASDGTNEFTLELSTDDGGSWTVVGSNISADSRFLRWPVPAGINSGKCRLRLTRGSDVFTTDSFVINDQPEVELSAVQCPGYISIDWKSIPNATEYHVLRKIGGVLVSADTTTDTTFVFAGLNVDSAYYVSVRPLIDGKAGYRAIAIMRQPNDGTCAGSISDGDLMVEKVSAPAPGRMFTQTQLSNNEKLIVHLRNLDDQAYNSYAIAYSINNATWVNTSFADVLPAIGKKAVSVGGLDLSALGDYHIRVAVTNTVSTDNVSVNDTVDFFTSQLPNDPIVLNFSDGFESLSVFSLLRDSSGFGIDRRWDYRRTTDTGRLSTFVLPQTTISGQRSISLDAYRSCRINNYNILTATFNMAGYDANKDEIRLEFDYMVHGRPKTEPGNAVTARGRDDKSKEQLYAFGLKRENIGKVINSGSVSFSDFVLSQNDNFSTSSQITFGQNDTSLIGGRNIGNGITVDNVRLYTVQNDVQLLEILSPANLKCGIITPSPLTVKVRNGVAQQQNNVQISYRINNGALETETIASIAGKQAIEFTFSKQPDISQPGTYSIDAWVSATGDTYSKNDSIINYIVRHQPLISSFPYFEDFESSDGFWYSDGINNSWQYGVPVAPKVSAAASGQKAWVTNLDGNYNANEISFLYSPCFDLSAIDSPVLTFKLAQDIENCGIVLCDAGFLDYSVNGTDWERLGLYGDGINWYNDSNYQVWTSEDKTAWLPAEISLPEINGNVRFRFGLQTDPGAEKEGLGIDDIKIFNRVLVAPQDNILNVSPNPATDGLVNIEWTAHGGTVMNLVITDIMGRVVHSMSAVANEGYNKTTVNAPVLAPGMYFVRFTIGDKEHVRKVVFRRS